MINHIDSSQPNHPAPARRPSIAIWILSTLWLLTHLAAGPRHAQALTPPPGPELFETAYGIGELVSHVQCQPGYTATLYASGLNSPDGLAFGPAGALHVVEEGANRVSRIEPDGSITPVLEELRYPEGITFDASGNLYVVEDVPDGRLLQRTSDGLVITLVDNLQAPEDVVVQPNPADSQTSMVYVTESNMQFTSSSYDLQTGIAAISALGDITHVISHTPTISGSVVAFWSYAGLTAGPDDRLYVTNELSGQAITREVVLVPGVLTFTATLLTDDSIFAVDPVRGTRQLFARGLLAPEGLSFSAGGDFPLYVAEENVGNKARLSRVEADGRWKTVCDSFHGIEDVIVDAEGDLYVSEDKSGNVIRIQRTGDVDGAQGATTAPLQQPAASPVPQDGQSPSSPDSSPLHVTWTRIAAFARWIARFFQERSSSAQ